MKIGTDSSIERRRTSQFKIGFRALCGVPFFAVQIEFKYSTT